MLKVNRSLMRRNTTSQIQNDVNRIIIHHTTCPKGNRVSDLVNNFFRGGGWAWSNITDGYHYVISRDGEIFQLVSEERLAFGASGHNNNVIHVAIQGNYILNNPTLNSVDACVSLLEDILSRYEIEDILPHSDVSATSCPGLLYPILMDRLVLEYIEEIDSYDKCFTRCDEFRGVCDDVGSNSDYRELGLGECSCVMCENCSINRIVTHTVQEGDTLTHISRMYNISLAELISVNPQIDCIDHIFIGDKITIPL